MRDRVQKALMKSQKKYASTELTLVEGVEQAAISSRLVEKNFKLDENGYYVKFYASLFNDAIRYAVKLVDTTSPADTLVKERKAADRLVYGAGNDCLILIMSCKTVTEKDKALLTESAKFLIGVSGTLKDRRYCHEFLPVLLDRERGTAYFLEMGRAPGAVYRCGCALLKKDLL